MKILFVCNSLEDGKDGVGDYTRKIANECKKNGISPVIIGFNDRYVSKVDNGIDQTGLTYHRIPMGYSLAQKEFELSAVIKANTPFDWVSLQFVSYGFDTRGIVRKNIPVFGRLLKGCKIHVMVHELWLGEERQASLKAKLLGKIQKRYIIAFFKAINPMIIQTSIPLFKKMLEVSSVKSSILPLFSNISYQGSTNLANTKSIPPVILNNHDDHIIGCLFGSIYHTSWDMHSLLSKLQAYCRLEGKRAIVASIGRIGHGEEFWNGLPDKYKDIEFLTLGEQNEDFISYWLTHFVDLGIVTAPALIAGKSGSCMAFLEHGVPVFCKRNELTFNFKLTDDLIDPRINEVDDDFEFSLLPHTKPAPQLKKTVQNFVNTLNNIQ